jgi:hypothetical protein
VSVVLLAPAIAVVVLCIGALGLHVQRRGQLRLVSHVVDNTDVGGSPGTASLLFFSSATCAICHTAQRPAVDVLSTRLDSNVRIREIDVAREPDVARRYRVMSLPTTVILRPDGAVAAINVGFASAQQLLTQLADVSAGVPR